MDTALKSSSDIASIHYDLVDALYSTPRPIMIGAATVTVVMVGAGSLAGHDPVFYILAGFMAIVGLIRLVSHRAYRQFKLSPEPSSKALQFEWLAMFGAWSTAALISCFGAYAVLAYPDSSVSILAIAQTIGYLAGLSGRNTSRPIVTKIQVLIAAMPFTMALMFTGKPTYILIALTVLLTMLLTFSSAQVIYEVFVSRQKTMRDLERMANLDSLTELYNRRGFIEFSKKIASSSGGYTLISVDVDNFKDINDTYGHDIGDSLIRSLSIDLSKLLTESEVAARIGGDEFMIAVPGKLPRAIHLATRLLQASQTQRRVADLNLTMTVSIGIVEATSELPLEEALKQVDIALYKAKADGRNRYVIYSPALSAAYDDQLAIQAEMREGIRRGQFWLAYQPIYNPRSGTVTHVEALLRWAHPTRGAISPALFIPIAERTGLIRVLGAWAIEEAARTAASLPRKIRMSVNVSPHQFDPDHDLVAIVRAALTRTKLAADQLIVEITESALMKDDSVVNDTLKRLRDMGVGIALDDFGTGYSSLSYLAWLPINILKIDRAFCRDIETSPRANALMNAITLLAHDLDLLIIVEGIETEQQLAAVKKFSVHGIQGYVFARPMTGQALHEAIDVRVPGARSRNGVEDDLAPPKTRQGNSNIA